MSRGWILSISVYCIPTRDTHITRDMCTGIHISLWQVSQNWSELNCLDEFSHNYQVNSPAWTATRVKVGGLNNHPFFEMRTTYLLSKIEQNRIYLSNIFTLMAILIVSARFIQTFQLNPNHQHRILSCSYSSRSCCCCYDFRDGLVYTGIAKLPLHCPISRLRFCFRFC